MKGKTFQRIAIVVFVIAAIALFKFFDLGQYFSLEFIKESQGKFATMYAEHPVMVVGGYMLVYIVATALSLPGAAVLSLVGGGLLGFWVGLVAISFASSIGATLACFVSRFLLQEWVQGKFGDKLTAINKGIDEEGAFYLFTLRLIPIFPFFVINLVMGLTKMPLLVFYGVSQLGMLPATVVFVNAGKELAKVDSLSGILSPSLIISFAILGLFPIAVKKIMAFVQARRQKSVDVSAK